MTKSSTKPATKLGITKLGIIVNPMSGRDVRRVTAKASTSAHHDKQQLVTRLILGAFAHGVDEIYLGNEPFRINERAIEGLENKAKITIFSYPLKHTHVDTNTLCDLMWEAGCRVFIVLGGDGTNRIVAKHKPDAIILPLSTGTNNVFPLQIEASVAGAAAGIIATNLLSFEDHCRRCKQVHISINGKQRDLALIDAVLLRKDHLGSLLPFTSDNIQTIFLARAEPASVGISPIGGFLMPCHAQDEFGVLVNCGGPSTTHNINIPLSPGLYGSLSVCSPEKMELGQPYHCETPGILAFDGDRSIELKQDDIVEVTIRRDGPWIIQPNSILEIAALHGLLTH